VDFDAHFKRLKQAADGTENDANLWTLVGYYAFFSGDKPEARDALAKALKLAPRDYVINEMYEAADLLTPSAPRRRR
jgi:Flp pilus assembly protein TadD